MENSDQLKQHLENKVCVKHKKSATIKIMGKYPNKEIQLHCVCCEAFESKLVDMVDKWLSENNGEDTVVHFYLN